MIEFKAKSLCKLRRRFSKTSRLLISETKIIIVITSSGYLTFRWLVREVSVDCIFGCLNILHIYSIAFFLWWLPTQNKRTFSKLYAFVQVSFSLMSLCDYLSYHEQNLITIHCFLLSLSPSYEVFHIVSFQDLCMGSWETEGFPCPHVHTLP